MSKKSSCQQSGQCLNPHFTFQQLRDFTKGLRSLVLLFFCSYMKRKELHEGMNRAPWLTWLKMHAVSSMTQQIMISRPPHVIEFGSPIWCEMKPCTAGFMIKKRIWYLSSKSKAGYKGLTSGTFFHVSDDQTNCLMHENKCEVYILQHREGWISLCQNPAVLSGAVCVLTGMKVSGRRHAVSSASRSK